MRFTVFEYIQAYSLQRNVLRVLTFIATSGKQGALFLFSKNVDFVVDQSKENDTSKKSSSSVVPCSLPVQLMSLLDEQLKEEEERCSSVKAPEMEERYVTIVRHYYKFFPFFHMETPFVLMNELSNLML